MYSRSLRPDLDLFQKTNTTLTLHAITHTHTRHRLTSQAHTYAHTQITGTHTHYLHIHAHTHHTHTHISLSLTHTSQAHITGTHICTHTHTHITGTHTHYLHIHAHTHHTHTHTHTYHALKTPAHNIKPTAEADPNQPKSSTTTTGCTATTRACPTRRSTLRPPRRVPLRSRSTTNPRLTGHEAGPEQGTCTKMSRRLFCNV